MAVHFAPRTNFCIKNGLVLPNYHDLHVHIHLLLTDIDLDIHAQQLAHLLTSIDRFVRAMQKLCLNPSMLQPIRVVLGHRWDIRRHILDVGGIYSLLNLAGE